MEPNGAGCAPLETDVSPTPTTQNFGEGKPLRLFSTSASKLSNFQTRGKNMTKKVRQYTFNVQVETEDLEDGEPSYYALIDGYTYAHEATVPVAVGKALASYGVVVALEQANLPGCHPPTDDHEEDTPETANAEAHRVTHTELFEQLGCFIDILDEYGSHIVVTGEPVAEFVQAYEGEGDPCVAMKVEDCESWADRVSTGEFEATFGGLCRWCSNVADRRMAITCVAQGLRLCDRLGRTVLSQEEYNTARQMYNIMEIRKAQEQCR